MSPCRKKNAVAVKTHQKSKPKYDLFGRREDRLHFLAKELYRLCKSYSKYEDSTAKTTFSHLIRELLGLYFGHNKKPGSAGLKSVEAKAIVEKREKGKTVSDHVVPLKILQDCFLAAIEMCKAEKKECVTKIEDVLRRNAYVVRISTEEDERLKDKDLRESMPKNWKDGDSPWERYRRAKIEVWTKEGKKVDLKNSTIN